ncbi:MAG TPA: NDP-sugar synthase [Acidimicrobiales bacterium]|jgi:mannose-1-phosphate guanylyltransferase|nr:NDP-sugar synthase [Acidimicrobiales bacterium]
MRAVVLVGGFGTRLRPLTVGVPKQMLPIVHVPMIERVVGGLAAYGVTEAILSLGYRPDAFLEAYPDGICAGIPLHYAVEPEPLDTAGAIRFAARHAGVDSTFVVVNGDVINEFDLGALVALHRRAGAEGTIHLTPVDDPSRYGVVPTDERGRVEGFIEKPPRDEAPTNWINAGTYVFEPSVLDRIPDGRPVSVERDTFPAMVRDASLYALQDPCYWVDAGTPATYLQVNLDLVAGRRGTTEAAWHPSATVHPRAMVKDSVLGPGVRVGADAVVVDSVVLDDAEVGAGARVEYSVVGRRASLGDRAEVANLTVIGHGEHVPAGGVFDGQRVPDVAT